MDAKIIGEVWQAFSTLSDAQEFLGDESFTHLDLPARMAAANDRVNHAKRHLQGFIDWAQGKHREAFRDALATSITCTLEGVESHEGAGGGQ